METLHQRVTTLLEQSATPEGGRQLKSARSDSAQVLLAGDGFILDPGDPFAIAHRRIAALIEERLNQRASAYENMKLSETAAGQEIARMSPDVILTQLRASLIRAVVLDAKLRHFDDPAGRDVMRWDSHMRRDWSRVGPPRAVIVQLLKSLLQCKLPYTQDDLLALGTWLRETADDTEAEHRGWLALSIWTHPIAGIVKALSIYTNDREADQTVYTLFQQVAAKLSRQRARETSRYAAKIEALVGSGDSIETTAIPISPGEAWSDQALSDLHAMSSDQKRDWAKLLNHARTASAGKPTKGWLKDATALLGNIGDTTFKRYILTWFPLLDKPRTQAIEQWRNWSPNPNLMIVDQHADLLKGLVWCCTRYNDPDVARALTAVAVSAYKKVPGVGPRAVRIGNACVYALGDMPGMEGVAQLAILKSRIKFATAQKGIDRALTATAERVGIGRDELEEIAVPTYGLTEVGGHRVRFGDYRCELEITGSKVMLQWFKPDGKQQKSIPKVVKEGHPDALEELKQAAKDIERILPAQITRIEQLYLQQKRWTFATWKTRYLDHALVGTLARRLIWNFGEGQRTVAAIYHHGKLVTQFGEPIDGVTDDTVVRLWHPLDADTDDIVAWRDWFVRHEVKQPFKQAHRELYILTEAERNTNVYSNRFAAHILKQHQFNALCGARGWKNQLRLMVDDGYRPAHLELPQWGVRAEYWVEGIGEHYGVDTNDTGTYYYIVTDQVRFYPIRAAENWAHAAGGRYITAGTDRTENHPIPMSEIPPLVLSEVMRDVDLFVGVASIGNDPNWSDGGPEGRYVDYWHSYAFGDLGTTAQTRKAVLERLVPRLKIGDRCTFGDRFLIVRGDIRTYKIHLGSGNILMEPNDAYLCIVAKQGMTRNGDKVFLPFEGDNMTSIILSKAFLLASDSTIKDPTIISQLKR